MERQLVPLGQTQTHQVSWGPQSLRFRAGEGPHTFTPTPLIDSGHVGVLGSYWQEGIWVLAIEQGGTTGSCCFCLQVQMCVRGWVGWGVLPGGEMINHIYLLRSNWGIKHSIITAGGCVAYDAIHSFFSNGAYITLRIKTFSNSILWGKRNSAH